MIILAIILTLLMAGFVSTPAQAMDKKLGATNCFKVGIFDTEGNGITGIDVVLPYDDTTVKIQCGAQAITTVDESGDSLANEGGGYYYICTNDSIANANEEECLGWVEGQGNYSGLIAKSPVKFKAVSDTDSVTTCDISAATSGTSFTIATCIDENGTAITLATDTFVGSYMVATTNGAAQCNVVGQGVFVSDLTAGVVTVKETDMPGSGFSATPSISNCGVRISP